MNASMVVSPRPDATKDVASRVESSQKKIPNAEDLPTRPKSQRWLKWPIWKGRVCEPFRESSERTRIEDDEDRATCVVCARFLINVAC